MFEVRSPIPNFLLLVLGVSFNATPDGVHERPGVSNTLSKEAFELDLRQGGRCLALTLVLVPTKADSVKKERSCKRGDGIVNALTLTREKEVDYEARIVKLHLALRRITFGQPAFARSALSQPATCACICPRSPCTLRFIHSRWASHRSSS